MAEKKAEAKKAEAAPAVIEEAPKKKRGLLPLVVIVVVLVAGGGTGAWYFLSHKAHDSSRGEGATETADRSEPERPPVFEKLDTFTVNLSGGEDRYLQAEISLKIADAEVGEKIKVRMPEVRDRMLRLLSAKTPEALASIEGKEALAREIRQNLNQLLGVQAKTGVESVLFTSFIIQ